MNPQGTSMAPTPKTLFLCSLAHDKGYCVIIVTHDLEVADAADVALRMRDGQLRDGLIDKSRF